MAEQINLPGKLWVCVALYGAVVVQVWGKKRLPKLPGEFIAAILGFTAGLTEGNE